MEFTTGTGGLRSSGNRACVFQRGDSFNGSFLFNDALEFPDGCIVLLTRLSEGQEATVLQLPAQPTTAAEADAQKRIAYLG